MKQVCCFLLVVVGVMIIGGSAMSQTAPDMRDAIARQTKLELAKCPNGEYMYRESDLFERMIDNRVRRHLGIVAVPGVAEMDDPMGKGRGNAEPLAIHPAKDITNATSDQDEPSIAISRKDSKIIIAGANDDDMANLGMPVYLTTNEGVNWKTVRMPIVKDADMTAGGDPMIVSDDKGRFYYAFLIFDAAADFGFGLTDLMLGTSPDGSIWTLTKPVMGITKNDSIFEDKEAIAVDCDPQSPHYHRIYVVWTHFDERRHAVTPTQLYIATSDDVGATWKHHAITGAEGRSSEVRVGKGGTVFIASDNYNTQSGAPSHQFRVSNDGGATFAMTELTAFTQFPINNIGRPGLKGDAGFRAKPYPSFDVDMRDNTVHLVYGDYSDFDGVATENYVTRDAQGIWTDPLLVGNTNITADRFLPWVTFDQSTHTPYVSYYSSEEDVTNNAKVRLVRTPLAKLDSAERVGARLFDPNLVVAQRGYPFIGDYTCSDACLGSYATAWTENKSASKDGEIYAYVNSATGSGVIHQLNHQGMTIGQAMPNPASGKSVSFGVTLDAPRQLDVTLLDAVGKMILREHHDVQSGSPLAIDISGLAAGKYYCQMSDGVESVMRAFVVVR